MVGRGTTIGGIRHITEAVARSDTNLPAARGRLIGREQEAALVRELILHADGRLVTLTGAGGIGKTSLAFDVARRLLDDMPDGIWLVDLETVEDESAVATSACRSLGLADQQGRSQSDVLSDFL